MVDPKSQAKALRDECERLAREAERKMLSPDLTKAERNQAMEAAKVYWQMSRKHADSFAYAEAAQPERFTAKNKGQQSKTIERQEFLRQVAREIGTTKRQSVCLAAMEKSEFNEMFDNYEQAHRFAQPTIFDGIRKQS
jgi:hypothetical protein